MSDIKNHPFLGTSCKRELRTCQGVKICKFASLQILEGKHTAVDFENEYFRELFNQEEYNPREFALCQFVAAHKSSCKFVNPNTNVHCNGRPILRKHKNLSTGNTFFIGCSNWDWKNPQTGHRYISVNDTRTDAEYLEELFRNFTFCSVEEFDKRDDLDLSQVQNCNTILHYSSRQTTCRFPHIIGNTVVEAPIILQKCSVQFNSFVPEDIKSFPFIAVVSKGIHNHLPPPPVTTPSNVLEQLNEIIKHEDILDITTRKLLTGKILKMYLNNTASINDLHISLNGSTKLNYYIKKQKRLQYPYGSDLMGVVHELLHQQNKDSYIRNVHIFDDGKIFVICMTKKQSREFQNLKYIEIDAPFMVNTVINNNTIKEWEITSYVENMSKSLALARVFTNVETPDAYKHIFYEVFSIVEKDNERKIEFSYLNSNFDGMGCIIANAHKGQAIGLGKFLHERYPCMSIEEHLQHIYRLSTIHYIRNIDNLNVSDEIKHVMKAIPNCKTQAEVEKAFSIIESCECEDAKDWVADNKTPWILAGISPAYTKMALDIWNINKNDTNVNESARNNININKTSLSLLAAIKKAEELDRREWDGILNFEKYNLSITGRNKSQVQKYKESARHSKKGKEKERATNCSGDLTVSSSRPTKKQRVQKNKDNSNDSIQINDLEIRQKWLEQEQQAIELLKQEVALKKELFELNQKQKDMDMDVDE